MISSGSFACGPLLQQSGCFGFLFRQSLPNVIGLTLSIEQNGRYGRRGDWMRRVFNVIHDWRQICVGRRSKLCLLFVTCSIYRVGYCWFAICTSLESLRSSSLLVLAQSAQMLSERLQNWFPAGSLCISFINHVHNRLKIQGNRQAHRIK